jgi:glycosyltransferase involved in cell wall biosynthesis
MEKLSVIIITFNEEKNIRDCLESVKWADEIIVVDSFSSDNTIQICKEYTNNIFQRKWEGFAKQKNFALNLVKNKWVLWIDADERVSKELKEEIEKVIENNKFDGFCIPRKNFFLGRWIKYGGWYPDYTLRLFKKEKAYFEEREVHEKVILNGKISYLKSPILHYSYKNISDIILRIDKYSSLSSSQLLKNNKKATLWTIFSHSFFRFFLKYILRGGFRDGVPGFIIAVTSSFETFAKYAKLWERENAKEYAEKD